MALDLDALATSIEQAMLGVFTTNLKGLASLAESEAQKLAQTLVSIELMTAQKEINPQQAAILLDMQEHATRSVLLSIEGIGLLTVEKAINAGLAVVANAVNTAVGFPLIT